MSNAAAEDVSRDLEFCFKMLNLNVYVRCILTTGCTLNTPEEKNLIAG